jgi:hypothetical protein
MHQMFSPALFRSLLLQVLFVVQSEKPCGSNLRSLPQPSRSPAPTPEFCELPASKPYQIRIKSESNPNQIRTSPHAFLPRGTHAMLHPHNKTTLISVSNPIIIPIIRYSAVAFFALAALLFITRPKPLPRFAPLKAKTTQIQP